MAPDTRIPRRWQPWIRTAWLAVALLLLALAALGLPPRFAELQRLCAGAGCPPLSLAPSEATRLQALGLTVRGYAGFQLALELLNVASFSTMAALIFWRKSDDWIGILTAAELLFIGLIFYPDAPRALARVQPILAQPLEFLISVTVVLFMLLFYLFPDGRFAPRWLGVVAGALGATVLLEPLLNPSGPQAASASLVVVIAGMGGAVLGLLSQVYRYLRVSSPLQKQQTKWVLAGLICMLAASMVWAIFAEFAPLPPGPARLTFYFSLLPQYIVLTLFPVSLAVSILRFRLYDIDLILRRTLLYASLTAALALVYFGGVVVVQGAITGITGRSTNSPLTIVLSTLLIAALFNPLRRRAADAHRPALLSPALRRRPDAGALFARGAG